VTRHRFDDERTRVDTVLDERTRVHTASEAYRTRTGHPTPWSRQRTREVDATAVLARRGGRPSAPVFVDESGRRQRFGRLLAAAVGGALLLYLVLMVLAFAGAPGVGRLAPPGLERLARPSAQGGEVVVGPSAREAPLPSAATAPSGSSGEPDSTDPGATTPGDDGTSTTAATTSSSVTTTTRPGRGNGSTTSIPAPNSTVPDRPTGGGPPDTPPGQQ
jgi:hypothetical protein